MPLSESILSNISWNKFSLKFINSRLEAHYQQRSYPSLLTHSRIALLLGAIMYQIYGILDYLLIPPEDVGEIIIIKTFTTFLLLTTFGLTFLRFFKIYNQPVLCFLLLLASIGVLLIMEMITKNLFPYYFSALLLLVFWAHAFYVLRFVYVFFASLFIFSITTVFFYTTYAFTNNQAISYLFILFTTSCLSVFSSYIAEKRDRAMFLSEKELDRERFILRELATHDSLTLLPNRVLLIDRIDQAIHDSNRNNQVCAGFFVDLDNFKNINDTYGHAAGDFVLTEVAKRLKSTVRAADTVARLSGDEFFVLARDIQNAEHAHVFGNKLLGQINLPYFMQDKPLDILLSASIGICMFPYDGVYPQDVLDKADHAMYQVKLADKSGIVVAEYY